MSIVTQAIYEHGFLKPLTKISLKEHEKVQISINPAKKISLLKNNNGRKNDPFYRLIGIMKNDMKNKTDLSLNHDAYIYSNNHKKK